MSQGKHFLHYDPNRIDYTVSNYELENIKNVSNNLWKDVCLVSVSLGLSTILNCISLISNQQVFKLTIDIFINALLGCLGLGLGIIFGIAWFKTHKKFSELIEIIKSKPKIELNPDMINVGSLPE